MKLVNKKRSGLFPGCTSIKPVVYEVCATIPVVEKLQAFGTKLEKLPIGYRITLGNTMPNNIVAVHLNEHPHLGLRLVNEPKYPLEFPDYWSQIDFTPCPVCNAPVIWYEAGYVPGYRICINLPYHHSLAN